MGVPQRCPIPSRLVEETTSTFVCSQPLAKSEICLQAPVGVLVDPTALATVQRNAGKTTRLTCSVTLSALSRMARSSGTDSSTSSPRAGRICSDSRGTVTSAFCALMRIVRAAFLTVFRRVFVKRVPTAPECRLLRNCLQPKPLAKFRMAFEVLVECCFVLPSVEFLQDE